MNQNNKVAVILTTFNGSKYIKQQIESIISQSYSNWELFIRDDGSTDETVEIIKLYASADRRIHILQDDKGNLRSAQNFNALMVKYKDVADYFMFCDQDDIWLQKKIEQSLLKMMEIENNNSAIVYGPQILIDSDGNILNHLANNFYYGIDLKILLATNFIYGCTIIINRKLLLKCLDIPGSAENHDYWVVLVAAISKSSCGVLKEPLMLYRQHDNNVSGSYKDSSIKNRLKRLVSNNEIKMLGKRRKMFIDLLTRTESYISFSDYDLIQQYVNLMEKDRISRLIFVIKNHIRKVSFLATVNYYWSIFRG
ncbi:glycosyltransferase family 2 protein [Sphingobacterium faecium]|uniref:glycosyltransferase family 2 protein n=1 Tax=Sphingobacterium faecium TaxID=34087 RepID=UPI002478760C|nr:glycosyltransferase family 2 protein [Sphingobacterium faecium]WGQ12739.1 glycosyltransferase family 2 protein [Sphingobacterium faecium]